MSRRLRVAALAVGLAGSSLVVSMAPSGAGPAVASATLVDINGREVGQALFRHGREGAFVATVAITIDNAVTGNPTAFHGLHIHAGSSGGCVTYERGTEPAPGARFTEVGGHWRRGEEPHGAHAGDLPSLLRNADGRARAEVVINDVVIEDIVGRALVVHHLADDFGKHPGVGTSGTAGNAGPRYACGVIAATASG